MELQYEQNGVTIEKALNSAIHNDVDGQTSAVLEFKNNFFHKGDTMPLVFLEL